MAEKRIIELAEATEFSNDDYLVVDSAIDGTRKLKESLITNAVGAPLVASTAAGMTDTDRVYVYTGSEAGYTSGNWYYYNGSSWTSGGVYNSTAFNTDTTLSTPGAAADAKATGDALDTKANTDGYYENLGAGYADNLATDIRANDQSPYLFRTSGGSVDIGDREYVNGIVGASVAWNQLVKNGDFSNGTTNWGSYDDRGTFTVSDNIATVTPTASNQQLYQSYTQTKDHIYFACGELKLTSATTLVKFITSNSAVVSSIATTNWQTIYAIGKASSSGATYTYFADTRTSDWDAWQVKNVNTFDLTQLLGSTIADYVYTLESGTAGAGIAWLKKYGFFEKPYYAYNAGSLEHVSGLTSHVTRGFNAWDEVGEVGVFNTTTGANVTNENAIRCKNLIPVMPATSYYCLCPNDTWALFYDESGNVITGVITGSQQYNNACRINGTVFTTPSNCSSFKFYVSTSYGNTYNHDICINLSWDGSRNGEYEPYVEHTYPLDSNLTLRGIPKLDANNNLYYDGDTYEAHGTVTRKYGYATLDGSTSWSVENSGMRIKTSSLASVIKPNADNSSLVGVVCDQFIERTPNQTWAGGATGIGVSVAPNGDVAFCQTGQQDMGYSAWVAYVTANPIHIVFPLATPTTETADAYQQVQLVDDFGTEEFVTTGIPVGHNTDYPVNLKAKLEMAPNSPSGDGVYVVKQTSGENEYVPLVVPSGIPSVPASDGTYTLKATVSGGTTTLTWEA